ncbi:peptidase M20 domain-containing protein 2-like isoform X2 [Convolutriloba macropyga]|uniref:peptidase M20 domain-containing protein 2-like isoform X2 n=1 Tax=Convolutriloba macropyga TaxID=536237 RepID=UPI003F52460C
MKLCFMMLTDLSKRFNFMNSTFQMANGYFEKHEKDLHQLSDQIWDNPELAFKEKFAHDLITDFFIEAGIGTVTKNYILDTAFKVEYVTGKERSDSTISESDLPCVAFFSEYDALPGIGHACGHNLIAVVGIASFLKLISRLDSAARSARVTLFGSPAEEDKGGKILMMRKGSLNKVDFALMAHPSEVQCCLNAVSPCLTEVEAIFHGKNAHGTTPWMGNNALDAAVLAYNNINTLRHWMHPSMRAHGIFTDGGKAPNIIPDRAELLYYFRAPDKKQLKPLLERAEQCFKAGADATGCTVEICEKSEAYDSVIQNPVLGRIYEKHMENMGYQFPPKDEKTFRGSTDMGDVSRAVPAIHPWFLIPCGGAPGHSVPFAKAAKLPQSFKNAMDSAECLAKTALEVLQSKQLFDEMKRSFKETCG